MCLLAMCDFLSVYLLVLMSLLYVCVLVWMCACVRSCMFFFVDALTSPPSSIVSECGRRRWSFSFGLASLHQREENFTDEELYRRRSHRMVGCLFPPYVRRGISLSPLLPLCVCVCVCVCVYVLCVFLSVCLFGCWCSLFV
jgi:hypothetical protein